MYVFFYTSSVREIGDEKYPSHYYIPNITLNGLNTRVSYTSWDHTAASYRIAR